jgi:hypothetical protein
MLRTIILFSYVCFWAFTSFTSAQEITCEVRVAAGKPQLFLYKNSIETTRGSLFQSGLLTGEFQLTGKAGLQVVWAALRVKTLNLKGKILSTARGKWQLEVPLSVEETTILNDVFQESQVLLRTWIVYGDYVDNARPGKVTINWDSLLPFLLSKNPRTPRDIQVAVLEAMTKQMIQTSETGEPIVQTMVYYLRRTLYDHILEDGQIRLSPHHKKKLRGNSELDFKPPFYVEQELLLHVSTPQVNWKEHVTETILGSSTGTRVQKVQFYVSFDLEPWNIQKIVLMTEMETPKGIVPGRLVILDKGEEIKGIAFTLTDPGKCKLYYSGKIYKTDRTQVLIPRTQIHNPPFNFSVPVHTESLGEALTELLEK